MDTFTGDSQQALMGVARSFMNRDLYHEALDCFELLLLDTVLAKAAVVTIQLKQAECHLRLSKADVQASLPTSCHHHARAFRLLMEMIMEAFAQSDFPDQYGAFRRLLREIREFHA